MLLPMLNKATEYLGECLKNEAFVKAVVREYPEVFNNINWAQDILLTLFYKLKELDKELMIGDLEIAREADNLEIDSR